MRYTANERSTARGGAFTLKNTLIELRAFARLVRLLLIKCGKSLFANAAINVKITAVCTAGILSFFHIPKITKKSHFALPYFLENLGQSVCCMGVFEALYL
jgi:hypothetical protein